MSAMGIGGMNTILGISGRIASRPENIAASAINRTDHECFSTRRQFSIMNGLSVTLLVGLVVYLVVDSYQHFFYVPKCLGEFVPSHIRGWNSDFQFLEILRKTGF